MKALSVAGTAAMFLVGGGILAHGIAPLHHCDRGAGRGESMARHRAARWPMLLDALVGIVAGALVLAVVTLARRIWPGSGGDSDAARAP